MRTVLNFMTGLPNAGLETGIPIVRHVQMIPLAVERNHMGPQLILITSFQSRTPRMVF